MATLVLDHEIRVLTVIQHFNKRHEKVVWPISQLLNVSMLVRRPFIAENGEALNNDIPVQIQFFTQRFHDQLLKIS